MADSKITALTSIGASTDPANDPLVLVDVSDTSMAATGTTKKVTLNQLLGASGTATLASATITGDLTVDTSTLKVDSANNRVIVGHTSGSAPFQVTNAGAAGLELHPTGASSAPLIISYNRSGLTYTQLTIDASTIVHQLSGSTAMTLNSTGLGVGAVPTRPLQIKKDGVDSGAGWYTVARLLNNAETKGVDIGYNNSSNLAAISAYSGGVSSGFEFWAYNSAWYKPMTLDASGNLLVGTTSLGARNTNIFSKSGGFALEVQQRASGSAGSGLGITYSAASPNNATDYFLYCADSTTVRLYANSNGNVLNTNGSYGTISDLRLKENISDARNYLADLLKLRVVKYSLKSEASAVATKIGLIAQEVEQVFPTLVETGADDNKSIKTTVLIPMLLKAIQELAARVEALEA